MIKGDDHYQTSTESNQIKRHQVNNQCGNSRVDQSDKNDIAENFMRFRESSRQTFFKSLV